MATLTIAPRPAFDPKTATLQQVPGQDAWNAAQQRRMPKLNLKPKIGLPPVSSALAPRPLLPPVNGGPQAPAPFPSTFSGPQQPMPSAPIMQAPPPLPTNPAAPQAPPLPAASPGAMAGLAGLGQRFAAALPKMAAPQMPVTGAAGPVGAVAPATTRPPLGSGLLSKPFGTGMNNEKPLVPYQGTQGNGAPAAGKGTIEDYVKRGLSDASPHMAGRHLDKISTGRFKGKLKSQAVQELEDEYNR